MRYCPFLERAMSLIYINHSLNSSLLYVKPLHLMLASILLFALGETHHFIKLLLFSTYILHSIIPYSIFEFIFTDLLQKDT